MKILIRIVFVTLLLCRLVGLNAQTEKRSIKVIMVVPDPTVYSTGLSETLLNTSFNAINAQLIDKQVNVIDKFYVDQALKELRQKKDLDIAAASIEYGKKNMADMLLWYRINDKSASYADKRFVCEIKAIDVRTGQIVAIASEEGIDREDNEKAVAAAARKTTDSAYGKIMGGVVLFTVTFIGELSLKEQEKLDSIFDKMPGVRSFDGYSISANKYEYRISYVDVIRTLRNNINTQAERMGIRLKHNEGTVNSLSFFMLPKPNIHNSLAKISGYSGLILLGGAGVSYFLAESNYQKYKDATNSVDMLEHKDNFQKFDDYTLYAGIGAGTMLSWYLIERSIIKTQTKVKAYNMGIYAPGDGTLGICASMNW